VTPSLEEGSGPQSESQGAYLYTSGTGNIPRNCRCQAKDFIRAIREKKEKMEALKKKKLYRASAA